MAHDYKIYKIVTPTDLFEKRAQLYQIVCDGAALVDLCRILRTVIGHAKTRPLNNEEQDVLCDLYNSISIYKLKHKII